MIKKKIENLVKVKYKDFFYRIIIALSIYFVFYILTIIVSNVMNKLIERNEKVKNFSSTLFYEYSGKGINFILLFVGILIAASKLGFNINTVVILLGSMGLALALCMKDFLSQCVSGMAILFFKYFNKGDLITLNGEMGNIVEFNLLNTKISTINNAIITIPNNIIVNNSFMNYSKNKNIYVSSIICISNKSKIDYETTIKELKNELLNIKYIESKNIRIRIDDMSGLGTKIKVMLNINPKDYNQTLEELNFKTRNFFNKKGIMLCDY